jgi:hypothetical protein
VTKELADLGLKRILIGLEVGGLGDEAGVGVPDAGAKGGDPVQEGTDLK